MKIARPLLLPIIGCLAAFLLPIVLSAQPSGTFAIINKNLRAMQTGASTTQSLVTGGYIFDAHVGGTPTTPSAPIAVTLPGAGGTRALSFAPDRSEWTYTQAFDSAAALGAAFPNGDYTFAFGGRSVVLALNGDLYPAAPVATVSAGTWSGNTLTVDRTQPLTLTISFPQNFLAGSSRLSIAIQGAPGTPQGLSADTASSGFSQTQLSLTVPAGTLASATTYTVELEANRIVTLNSTAVPGYNVGAIYSASTTFALAVAFSGPPTIIQEPANAQIASGTTVVFGPVINGATSYQWRKNDAPITGATNARLVLFGATAADAGNYSVVATNASGSKTSLPATLSLATGFDFGRLTNLSILTDITEATPRFTLGTVIGGAGVTGAKPLLIRAVGPSLNQLIGTGALPDSKLDLYEGSTVIASNDDWAGAAAVTEVFGRVGAFPFTGANSKDAAIFRNLEPRDGGYTVVVSGAAGATGRVIAEFYDATSPTGFRATTPRLVNLSVNKQIEAGSSLTAGFVIGGSTAKTVLVRAIGPGLGVFGVPGVMTDPRLDLFNASSVRIAANDNWGGDAQLTAAGSRVGAFEIANRQSADAMLLVTLAPGNYSAEVRGANGGGVALVEVYEVP